MTLEQIVELIKKEGVKVILLQFSDLAGQVKVVETEAHSFADIAESGKWYDGSSIEGHARICESDMLLKPDLATFAILPWTNTEFKSARVMCDIYTTDDKHFAGDPRYVLKKALAQAKDLGFDYYTAAELEFFLFERDKLPGLIPHDRKGYFDYTPISRASRVCRKALDSLAAFNIKGETYHHEVANGQHEIAVSYDQALKSADNVLTIKTALKAYANQENLKATFMPKPLKGVNGSGMHVHQSLFYEGKNAFYEAGDEYNLSRIAYLFIAGQLKHAKALTAIVSPTANSYKRLVPGHEAPINICWGRVNRSALIRVPRINQDKTQSARIELRCPDPLANPYLAFAAMLICGLDGIKNQLPLPAAQEENVYLLSEQERINKGIDTLPADLPEAIIELEKDEVIRNLLGEHLFQSFVNLANKDIEQARLEVTPWEILRYL